MCYCSFTYPKSSSLTQQEYKCSSNLFDDHLRRRMLQTQSDFFAVVYNAAEKLQGTHQWNNDGAFSNR